MDFEDLSWAALLAYYIFSRDEDYQSAMRSSVTGKLRTSPKEVPLEDYEGTIVDQYLNKWGSCRVRRVSRVAERIRDVLVHSISDFRSVLRADIQAFDFESGKLASRVATVYDRLLGERRIGPTISSKILHLMNPSLFSPWDKPMRVNFCERLEYPLSWDDGETYVEFLEEQQAKAKDIARDFAERFKGKSHKSPAGYLSKKLKYDPSKTLVKFIDEYNWVTLSHMEGRTVVPPSWLPGSDSR